MRMILGLAAGLWSGAAAAASIGVSIDLNANKHPFSQQIFGVAYGNSARNAQMGYTVDRWGGNSTTRYTGRSMCTTRHGIISGRTSPTAPRRPVPVRRQPAIRRMLSSPPRAIPAASR